jgi:DNA-binding response OmpR family regulator
MHHLLHLSGRSSPSSVRKIIVAEDDSLLRESLVHYLKLQNYEVTGVGSALGLYKTIAREPFAVAILDFTLPDQDGLVITKYLRINTDSRIILLTTSSSVLDTIEGYNVGADICLVKPIDCRVLAAAVSNIVKRLEDGYGYSAEKEVTYPRGSWMLVPEEWLLITSEGDKLHLTSKEYVFLNCLAEAPQGIVSRNSLLKILGYEHNDCGNRSLESLVYRLRKKISPTLDTPIKTANGSGYTFVSAIECCL